MAGAPTAHAIAVPTIVVQDTLVSTTLILDEPVSTVKVGEVVTFTGFYQIFWSN